jgi:multisubunit Na+/H+ antiporter MnhG subunit
LIVIGVFLFFTSPISGHAIAQVAHSQKVDFQGRDETKSKSDQTSDGEGA